MALSLFKRPEKVTSGESSGPIDRKPYLASEVQAGFLVTASLGVLIAFLFAAGGVGFFKETRRVEILFGYISGLAKNAPVHYAGHQVGKVVDIRLLGKNEGQIVVTASVSKEAVIRKNSNAYVDMLGFMGEKFLELTPGTPDSLPLEEGETLRGTDPIALNEIMKKGTEVADELQKTTVSLQGLIENLDQTVGENRAELQAIFKNLDEASRNLKEMTHDLKLHPWKLLKKEKNGKGRRFLFF